MYVKIQKNRIILSLNNKLLEKQNKVLKIKYFNNDYYKYNKKHNPK